MYSLCIVSSYTSQTWNFLKLRLHYTRLYFGGINLTGLLVPYSVKYGQQYDLNTIHLSFFLLFVPWYVFLKGRAHVCLYLYVCVFDRAQRFNEFHFSSVCGVRISDTLKMIFSKAKSYGVLKYHWYKWYLFLWEERKIYIDWWNSLKRHFSKI